MAVKTFSDTKIENDLKIFLSKMSAEGISPYVRESFSNYYRLFREGSTTFITEEQLDPVSKDNVVEMDSILGFSEFGTNLLKQTVCIKLNGGLGTSMGCNGPKSLITVKDGLSFLEITCKQLIDETTAPISLMLMNSFKTDQSSKEVLQQFPQLQNDLPQTFMQNKFPRIDADSLLPAVWSEEPQYEWNPPGHGDIYATLFFSGILKQLLTKNYRYAFISNIDNLGARIDPSILGYMDKYHIDFLMEVTDRGEMDRKGGHIAQLKNGHLILREISQCPPYEIDQFQNIRKYTLFNTNNLWVDLQVLYNKLDQGISAFSLPIICSKKKIIADDPSSLSIFQLESAMGSALSQFNMAKVLRVPRTRFIPVKTTDELLLLWSDFFALSDTFILSPRQHCKNPVIRLDSRYFASFNQLKTRFPHGAPSLRNCSAFSLTGDFRFGKNVSITGSVCLKNSTDHQIQIPDGSMFDADVHFNN